MIPRLTEVNITPVRPKGGLVAFVSFVMDESWYMGSIAIYTRPHGGYRLIYPTRKMADRNIPLFYPINKAQAKTIEEVVISHFEEVMSFDRHNSSNHA